MIPVLVLNTLLKNLYIPYIGGQLVSGFKMEIELHSALM
jgi:hypothetical protein